MKNILKKESKIKKHIKVIRIEEMGTTLCQLNNAKVK
uniref:Uncharacterized protein n=1 Tax=Rhizophora mucronata TaxID=61149 RepID=A0A2P2NG03_RHIMU